MYRLLDLKWWTQLVKNIAFVSLMSGVLAIAGLTIIYLVTILFALFKMWTFFIAGVLILAVVITNEEVR